MSDDTAWILLNVVSTAFYVLFLVAVSVWVVRRVRRLWQRRRA